MPRLLLPLTESYDRFLQARCAPEARRLEGLHAALAMAFPMRLGPNGLLTYESYAVEAPHYGATECLRRGLSFVAPLKVVVRLYAFEPGEATFDDPVEADLDRALRAAPRDRALRGVYGDWLEERERGEDAAHVRARGPLLRRRIEDIKEQELYFGWVPLMTEGGAFVIDGVAHALVIGDAPVVDPLLGTVQRRALPGDRLTDTFFHGALAVTEKVEQRATKIRELETLLPHDIVEVSALMRAVRRLFRDRRASVAAPTHLLAAVATITATPLEALVPCAADDPATRAEGAAAIAAAVVPVGAAPPRLVTGVEPDVARASGFEHAAHAGTVERPIPEAPLLLVWPEDAQSHPANVVCELAPFAGASYLFTQAFRLLSGARVSASEPLTDAEGIVGGELAFGSEARVVIDAKGKGLVVSPSFAAKMAFAERVAHEVTVSDTRYGSEELARPTEDSDHLDESGIVRVGALVRPGQVLVGKRGFREGEPVDASARVANDDSQRGPWRVLGVETFRRAGAEALPREETREAERRAWLAAAREAAEARGADDVAALLEDDGFRRSRNELPPGVVRFIRIVVAREVPLAPGDRLTTRQGDVLKVAEIRADSAMPNVGGAQADVIWPGKKLSAAALREARWTHALAPNARQREDDTAAYDAAVASKGADDAVGTLYLLRLAPKPRRFR